MNDQNFNQESYTPPIVEPVEPVSPFPPRPRLDLRAAFGSGLFLALCILMTVIAAFGSVSINIGEGGFQASYSFNIIAVLVTIGMWITFASAKTTDAPLKKSGLVMVSGSIKALRIIIWVVAIITLVSGLIITVFALAAPEGFFQAVVEEIKLMLDSPEFKQAMADVLGYDFIDVYLNNVEWEVIVPVILLTMGIFVCLVMVILMIFNVTYYKKLHQFARSLCACAEDPDALPVAANTVSIWLLVLGIFNILSGLTGIVMIIGYVFLKKYFVDIES